MGWRELDIVLHIGYHKTGTTFLQKSVFPNNPDILYLGRSWISKKLDRYFFDFSFTNDDEFNAIEMAERFANLMDEIVSEQNIDVLSKKIVLISHESLHSGSDYFGLRIEQQADRIKQVFPKAKIVIGIRNQLKMIESNYTNYIHHGGKLSFSNFFKRSKYYNEALREKLKYDELVGLYYKTFNRERVHVLIFEKVFSQSSMNLKDLDTFLNIESHISFSKTAINKKLSKGSIVFLRLLNSLLVKDFDVQYRNRLRGHQSLIEKLRWYVIKILKYVESLNIVPFSKKKNTFLTRDQISETEAYFEASNRNLAEKLEIDLRQFGYKY